MALLIHPLTTTAGINVVVVGGTVIHQHELASARGWVELWRGVFLVFD
jgi:hypothetical protein